MVRGNGDRESLSDVISRKLVGKLPRRARKMCGLTQAEAALTDAEIEQLCRIADNYTRRLASLGLVTPGRRRRHTLGKIGACGFVAATLALAVWASAVHVLDFDGDGRVDIGDLHTALDFLIEGRTNRLHRVVLDRDGEVRRILLTHLPNAAVPFQIQDDPQALSWPGTVAKAE